MRRTLLLTLSCGMALSLAIGSAWSSADWPNHPKWAVRKSGYDEDGNSAMLSPSNDTRTNLALLLADRVAAGKESPRHMPLFSWSTLDAEIAPRVNDDEGAGSRCQTNASGTEAFVSAVAANRALGEAEKSALTAARGNLKPDCSGSTGASSGLELPEAKSQQARQFAAYLRGASDFYGGDFTAATATFSNLSAAKDPWLRETALYMSARSELNRAQQSAFDEWGGIASPRKTDMAAAEAALTGLRAYLAAYPGGRYAVSAVGLVRRVHWLTGNDRELAVSYGDAFARIAPVQHGEIAQEIDYKLLGSVDPSVFTDPLLLAVSDLLRMRKEGGNAEESEGTSEQITRAEIEGQQKYFAAVPELYSHLLAAEALYVRGQPREVLALIPDAAPQPTFTYVQFSRQMLRGLALEAAGDRNARGFWLEMFGGAKLPWQREALELAYAMNEERGGGLARVFAANSPVRNPAVREILLEFTAGPDLLRQQASNKALPGRERDAALYVLLAKQLGHGFYQGFLGDLRLVPPDAKGEDAYFTGAHEWNSYGDVSAEPVPLGLFTGKGRLGDFSCPALRETAASLARTPLAARPRLCLAEFWRVNGLDDFAFDQPRPPDELGGARPQFPGRPFARQAVYQAVMADRAASADEKAYALYRAVRCYAPSGTNDCGGAEVPVAQRRAWFQRLKREFPRSSWAQQSQYYY